MSQQALLRTRMQAGDRPQTRNDMLLQTFGRQFLPELWDIIISFLPDRSDVKSLSLANHQLNRITLRLIWSRFTLRLYHGHRYDLVDHLSAITRDPQRARYITSLRVLFLDPDLESETTLARSYLGSSSRDPISAAIEAVFMLLDNVKYLTVVQISRNLVVAYLPPFSGLSGPITSGGTEQSFLVGVSDSESLVDPVLRALHGWLAVINLHKLSTVNISFEAVVRFLENQQSMLSLSIISSRQEVWPRHEPQTLALPGLRSLRTNIHWAPFFISPISPTHTLVLLDTHEDGGNSTLARHMKEVQSTVRILQAEEVAIYRLTFVLDDMRADGPHCSLNVIVYISRGVEGWGPLYNKKNPLQWLCIAFQSQESIHTCVLRQTHYSRALWTGREIPREFERDLASSMVTLEQRSPAPRVIVELGTLGEPDFVCWIFTMASRKEWTGEREHNPINEAAERENILYLAGTQ
ncbi:hypothetical protein DL93DRAFT_2228670 [Clavulina sp. PMI_390]|nr:hypothetical protein DL93DRAFT_2228670 [Clavulina sp. PMI_390]